MPRMEATVELNTVCASRARFIGCSSQTAHLQLLKIDGKYPLGEK
jgi:hypothetical protein